MEDFTGAYLARKNDIFALPRNQNHAVAIFHLGGIAIECRLKAMLLKYHRITKLGFKVSDSEKSKRIGDAMYDNPILNPGHNLLKAIEDMPVLNAAALSDSYFFGHLENIRRPLGLSNPDYINLRYIPDTQQAISAWQDSFNYINQWLQQNNRIIL
ncbi:MAG: hypothetical protein HOP34_05835 [Methylococcaceae bacterium]|nr:hypothetical protein [Methylococcaceae bacterium]